MLDVTGKLMSNSQGSDHRSVLGVGLEGGQQVSNSFIAGSFVAARGLKGERYVSVE